MDDIKLALLGDKAAQERKSSFVDLYVLLKEEWFDQIGDFDTDEEKHAPIDYGRKIAFSIYGPNSFFGSEFVDLYFNCEENIFYLRISINQPIGDYAWETLFVWYKSVLGKENCIKESLYNILTPEELDGLK